MENLMKINKDGLEVGPDNSAAVPAATARTNEPRQRFVIPWRLKPDNAQSLWRQGSDDAGCGSCPVD
jgi:hypothetical protein